ncbi:hypothetical protein GCM10023185_35400 [Hymenobacter saemangeumensis]|uniref:Secretion system C-terminal sorting domain-containing protein n=1 Tax=Hymenobacter saemangeumensis TaxID=1084522 RepID=A0ABP8IQ44_9BACT
MKQILKKMLRRACTVYAALVPALLAVAPASPALAQPTVLNGPTGSGSFGTYVAGLFNGNYVVTDPFFDLGGVPDVGAVYLYRGSDNTLISRLTGSTANDRVGSGFVGIFQDGSYVVCSPNWSNGGTASVGAVTWCNGTTGVAGAVSAANSLVGATANDQVGSAGFRQLPNGNYVVGSPNWSNGSNANAGAVTWCSSTGSTVGPVSAANSLVGSTANDRVGTSSAFGGIVPLTNDSYVVLSPNWTNTGRASAGAVTWCSSTGSTVGPVSAANSLVGSTANDQIGGTGFNSVVALTNGNYVVGSANWDNGAVVNAGAATWGNGTGGTVGPVSAANSLVGTTANDGVGSKISALNNGNYVVGSSAWDNGAIVNAGAVTWGSGTGGTVGPVSAANSLVGSSTNDSVGLTGGIGITTLTNGNYLAVSTSWDNGALADAGAVTWCNGTGGTVGPVSAANSLVGTRAGDQVGRGGVAALTNGNYVVGSGSWDNGTVVDAGAATWGNGASGIVGPITAANSLVGTTANDQVGTVGGTGITALSNGNYVVSSPNWDNGSVVNVGAATWGNGATGLTGVVSTANSLVGTTANDQVSGGSFGSVMALYNGNYVVSSINWDNGSVVNAGAATWCNGATGLTGVVNAANSLVGSSANDQVGSRLTALLDGDYIVGSPSWTNGSVMGAGAATGARGTGGTVGAVSAANSLVGSTANDGIGGGFALMSSRASVMYVSADWDNGSLVNAGAITQVYSNGSTVGPVTSCNSILGGVAGAGNSLVWITRSGTVIGGLPSENKVQVGVGAPEAPTGAASQSFAPGATVANLVATGTNVQFFATPAGGTALASSTALVNGTTYYAGQTGNGCASPRLAITVTLTSAPVDLVVSTGTPGTPYVIGGGTYNSITVTGTGRGQFTGPVTVTSSVVVQDGGRLDLNCQPLTGAASFTLASGATLVICDAAGITGTGSSGAVQVSGARSFSNDASYVYSGTAAQVTGNGLPATVRNLSTTNSFPLTLSQPVAVRQALTLEAAGNLSTSGQALTLLSNATGTALLANLGTGTVQGSVTVQRYLDPSSNAGPGYRHLAAPAAGQTLTSLGSGGTAPVLNPAYNTAATPGTVTPFPSVYRYDQSRLATSPATSVSAFDKGWLSPSLTSEAMQPGSQGYTVMLPGAQTLSFTGALVQSSSTLPLSRASGATAADAGWNFIGNPYASPLDFSTVGAGQRVNMDAAFYTFESSSQYGGQYRSYVNGIGNPLVGTAQAFFVRVSAGQTSGSLTFTNANRVTDYAQQAPVRRGAPDTRPQLTLRLAGAGQPADALTVYSEAGASAGFDSAFDAAKLPNTTGLNLAALAASGEPLSVQGVAAFNATVPLQVSVPAAGRYTFTAAALANLPAGTRAELVDNLTGTRTVLTEGVGYGFTMAGSTAPGRFWLNLTPAAAPLGTAAALEAQVLTYPNPSQGLLTVLRPAATKVTTAVLLNSLGQQVRHLALPTAETVVDLRGLAAGVYTLRLTLDGQPVSKRVVVE